MVRSITKIAEKLLLFALVTALPTAVQASAPAPIAGVWGGTLGTQKIQACFDERRWGTFGAYFYLKHLRAIPAEPARWCLEDFCRGTQRD